jgi:hypothetical protein
MKQTQYLADISDEDSVLNVEIVWSPVFREKDYKK